MVGHINLNDDKLSTRRLMALARAAAKPTPITNSDLAPLWKESKGTKPHSVASGAICEMQLTKLPRQHKCTEKTATQYRRKESREKVLKIYCLCFRQPVAYCLIPRNQWKEK